ncbi:polya polymerase [Lacrimispora sp. NSJ-141]|uniref:Polya polymerase n=2 Tax=Lachnospiraceae TaxID=186803 RepID=A0A7G9G6U5_9FIRM|nr:MULTISPECIES: polya polymerase [Lachnospiraceae]MCD2492988.1 polya polymerase [Lientehia hominis]QNM06527.1 polya polymerase [Qiania dongpingensis]
MKIKNVKDVEKFFKVIDECKGKVELVTDEGDRLNLKSKLTQYVALSSVFADATIGEMELIAHEPEDVQRLVMFMYDGEV